MVTGADALAVVRLEFRRPAQSTSGREPVMKDATIVGWMSMPNLPWRSPSQMGEVRRGTIPNRAESTQADQEAAGRRVPCYGQ